MFNMMVPLPAAFELLNPATEPESRRRFESELRWV